MIKCPLCGDSFPGMTELEKHIKVDHFLSMRDFYEIGTRHFDYYPLTYMTGSDGYYLPDWSNLKKKYEKLQAVDLIKNEIKDYYSNIVGDRFFQMFIVDNIYFSNTLPHNYEEFKEALKILQKKEPKDRNKIWFLDWLPGYPKIVSRKNIDGLSTIMIDSFYQVTSDSKVIKINEYEIRLPDFIPFDKAHHSRYNILNTSIDCRKTKRLRLKSREDVLNCIRFFNNKDESVKSLFRIMKGNIEVDPGTISYQDLTVIKLILLRNKTYLRLVFDMIEELLNGISVLSDPIFLRNTIKTTLESRPKLHISWLPTDKREDLDINISLL